MSDTSTSPSQPAIPISEIRKTAFSSSFGSALEYYDFALFSLAAALVFGPLYFKAAGSEALQSMFTMATYAIGFIVRPLGGIIFGFIGDRVGRKVVLVSTISLMGLSTALIGVLPTYESIGVWAPILLIFLRMLNGLGAGADQAGAAILMTELAPRNRRGFFASLPFTGIQIGTIAASLLFFFLYNFYGKDVVAHHGYWRIPFLVSIIILIIAVYMRLHMKESPVFKEAKKEQLQPLPLTTLVKVSRGTLLRGIGLRAAENGGSSIYQVLALSFIVNNVNTSEDIGTLAMVTAAIIGAIIVPVAGILTDKFGRIRVYRYFSILQILSALPAWYLFTLNIHVVTIATLSFVLGCATWGMFGAQGALMPEMFGSRARYTGVSVAREVSAVLAGGIAPFIGSWFITEVGKYTGNAVNAWLPIAGYVIFLGLITLFTTYKIPEVAGRDLNDPRDAIDASDSLIPIKKLQGTL